jgi:hypothetical protein
MPLLGQLNQGWFDGNGRHLLVDIHGDIRRNSGGGSLDCAGPFPVAVTMPPADTEATPVLLLDQVAAAFAIAVPLWFFTVEVTCCV